ncbi:hypothetical protein ACOME3_003329 [Neoechinorhynchus agilis]
MSTRWAEMNIMRWMYGVTRQEMISNNAVWGSAKVDDVKEAIAKRRIKWSDMVKGEEPNGFIRKVEQMEIEGNVECRENNGKIVWLRTDV